MKHSKRIKIGAAVGALVLAIATPVALAQVGDEDVGDLDAGAEGLICFEVGDWFGGPFGFDGEWPFEGDFPFEGMPGEEFGFEGEWPFEFDDGEFPPGFEFEFEGELLPAMDEMLDLLNEELMALAEHLENAGIDHEVVTGPMGIGWVEWDFSDPAANEAVEEFIIENGGFIDMAAGILPLHGPLHDIGEIPFGSEGLLFGMGEIPFGPEDLPFGMGEIPFGFEGLPFDLDEIPFGADGLPFDLQGLEGFFGADPWDLGEGFLGLSGEMAWGGAFSGEMMFGGPFGPGMVCVETIGFQADRISDEAAGLFEALAAAGIDVTIETRQIAVPVWDIEDEAAREVVEQYYADLLGLSRVVSGDGS